MMDGLFLIAVALVAVFNCYSYYILLSVFLFLFIILIETMIITMLLFDLFVQLLDLIR